MSAKASVFGRLTRDVETREFDKGILLQYTVASNSNYKDRDGNIKTSFIPVTQWVKAGDGRISILKKGTLVLVHGDLQQDTWQDQQGNRREKIYIKASEVEFGPKSSNPATSEPEDKPESPVPSSEPEFPF